jgi:hypothetical protein
MERTWEMFQWDLSLAEDDPFEAIRE